jgi:hypothetical protein
VVTCISGYCVICSFAIYILNYKLIQKIKNYLSVQGRIRRCASFSPPWKVFGKAAKEIRKKNFVDDKMKIGKRKHGDMQDAVFV